MARKAQSRGPSPWWSGSRPPWEEWPGVSIRIDATWSSARRRWESHDGKYYFDAAAADRACRFFPTYLRHLKGPMADQPFELLPWQTDLVFRPLFGWKRAKDGLRRFRKAFLEVGKKNGKSAVSSGLGLYLAFADGEIGAEVYSAAADTKQAGIVFGDASAMAEANPGFLADAGVRVLRGAIVQKHTNSSLKVLSSDVATKHGFNVHGLIFDEFHTQPDRRLYDTLYKGTSARAQPVVFIITTAGDDRESICYEEYSYAKNVLSGVITDEQYLPIVFEAGATDDWTKESTWRKANPSLGIAKTLEYMHAECAAAVAEPRKRNSFLRLELNVWTESHDVWIAPEAWLACQRAAEPADLADLVCCAGLDLSSTTDLTSLTVAFRRRDERPDREAERVEVETNEETGESRVLTLNYVVDLKTWLFMPRDTLEERARKDRIPYDLWAREGWVIPTSGNVVDYDEIRRVLLREVKPRYPQLTAVGYDPWNATQFATQLLADGVPMEEVRQGYATLSPASKLLEALVRSRRITHDGNPLVRWCFANAEVQQDPAGNIKPVKPKGIKRIDAVISTVVALSRLMAVEQRKDSVYRRRGIRVIGVGG